MDKMWPIFNFYFNTFFKLNRTSCPFNFLRQRPENCYDARYT